MVHSTTHREDPSNDADQMMQIKATDVDGRYGQTIRRKSVESGRGPAPLCELARAGNEPALPDLRQVAWQVGKTVNFNRVPI